MELNVGLEQMQPIPITNMDHHQHVVMVWGVLGQMMCTVSPQVNWIELILLYTGWFY